MVDYGVLWLDGDVGGVIQLCRPTTARHHTTERSEKDSCDDGNRAECGRGRGDEREGERERSDAEYWDGMNRCSTTCISRKLYQITIPVVSRLSEGNFHRFVLCMYSLKMIVPQRRREGLPVSPSLTLARRFRIFCGAEHYLF